MKSFDYPKRGLTPSHVYLFLLSFLLLEFFCGACLAGVIYEYREKDSGSIIGTLEIQSPPASANSGWSTAVEADLIALFLENAVFGLGSGNLLLAGGTLGFLGVSSSDGASLDGGGIAIALPTILPPDPSDPTIDQSLSIQFVVAQGEDFIGLSTFENFPDGEVVVGDLFILGDWVAKAAAVVPEPGALTLLGVGLLGIGWMGCRNRRRSVNT